ncbi:MAG: hypothetical protein JXA57_19460 [Armatimonadetes bacterium]|nr:hypothetical protein [Armatimonadota bacterium]
MLYILAEMPAALVVASGSEPSTTTISSAEVLEAVSQAGGYVDTRMTVPELLDNFPGELMAAVATLLERERCPRPAVTATAGSARTAGHTP